MSGEEHGGAGASEGTGAAGALGQVHGEGGI